MTTSEITSPESTPCPRSPASLCRSWSSPLGQNRSHPPGHWTGQSAPSSTAWLGQQLCAFGPALERQKAVEHGNFKTVWAFAKLRLNFNVLLEEEKIFSNCWLTLFRDGGIIKSQFPKFRQPSQSFCLASYYCPVEHIQAHVQHIPHTQEYTHTK